MGRRRRHDIGDSMKYYIMSKQYESFGKPSVAIYDNDKWAISGDAPLNFTGETVDLSQSEMTIEEFTVLIDQMRTEPPTGRLLIIPKWVGKELHKTHPAFMPANEEI